MPFRRLYRGDEIHSKRVRRSEQGKTLDRFGHLISVYELQGDLGFMEAERVTRRLIEDTSTAYYFLVDLTRVLRLDDVAIDLLNTARLTLQQAGKTFAIVTVSGEVPNAFEQEMHFPNIDVALEYFEDRLLERADAPSRINHVPLEEFDLLGGMQPDVLAVLREHVTERRFDVGQTLIAQNAPANELYFLTEGHVDVAVRIGNGPGHRVSTIDAGMMFGELALFGNAPRTADVVAATTGSVLVLDRFALDRLRESQPHAFSAMVLAVGSSLAERLRRANSEIRALSR